MERRNSTESRLDMLEFRISQIDAFIKKDSEEREEILLILQELKISQAKMNTIMGATAAIASGVIAAGGWFVQSILGKIFH